MLFLEDVVVPHQKFEGTLKQHEGFGLEQLLALGVRQAALPGGRVGFVVV